MNMFVYEADTVWNRRTPCNFSKYQSNCICYAYFFILWLTVSKSVSNIIFWGLNEKCVGLWGSYGLKQGNPLQFFQNDNKSLFVFCTNPFTYCIIKSIKVNKFWRWIEECRPTRHIFLHELWKKTFWKISFNR